jgi:hypothetical protein
VSHVFNTFTANYKGGWAKSPGQGVPGPSKTYPPDAPPTTVFTMFPTVYPIPFHYSNPVTADHPMTRGDYRERVAAVRGADRANRARVADLRRHFGIGPRLAERDRTERLPDLPLERCAGHIERQREVCRDLTLQLYGLPPPGNSRRAPAVSEI